MGQSKRGFRAAVGLSLVMALAGCFGGGGEGEVSRMKASPLEGVLGQKRILPDAKADEAESAVINALQARRSVLPVGSAFDKVATPVLAANTRAAESELRAARLKAEAQSKNWLPTIGPTISLTSLSDAVTSLVVDAVLFSGGRKKAERAFAIADVEVAAVNLAIDTNDRVETALGLYLRAQEAREASAMWSLALKDMEYLHYIMGERVKGGVSDMSDLNVIAHKLAKMRADHAAEQETARAALAELNAMSVSNLNGVSGVNSFAVPVDSVRPLGVLLAEAEKTRAVQGAKIERSGYLPSVTASKDLSSGAAGAKIAPTNALGLGTKASLEAVKATEEAAGRRVAHAQEEADRKIARLKSQVGALTRQEGEAEALRGQAKANLDLFQEQYSAGQRQVMDVVGVYETYATQARTAIERKYDLARARVSLASTLGVLADGSDI